jgi:hypothetical protein
MSALLNYRHHSAWLGAEGDFWWAVAGDGETRIRFIIEDV